MLAGSVGGRDVQPPVKLTWGPAGEVSLGGTCQALPIRPGGSPSGRSNRRMGPLESVAGLTDGYDLDYTTVAHWLYFTVTVSANAPIRRSPAGLRWVDT
jgi:hypothetical protein